MLVACPECAWVAIECDDEGALFDDARSLRPVDEGARCPRCGKHDIADFVIATDAQIKASGLTPEAYTYTVQQGSGADTRFARAAQSQRRWTGR